MFWLRRSWGKQPGWHVDSSSGYTLQTLHLSFPYTLLQADVGNRPALLSETKTFCNYSKKKIINFTGNSYSCCTLHRPHSTFNSKAGIQQLRCRHGVPCHSEPNIHHVNRTWTCTKGRWQQIVRCIRQDKWQQIQYVSKHSRHFLFSYSISWNLNSFSYECQAEIVNKMPWTLNSLQLSKFLSFSEKS